jgi:lysine/ornithine N-monooxygenase
MSFITPGSSLTGVLSADEHSQNIRTHISNIVESYIEFPSDTSKILTELFRDEECWFVRRVMKGLRMLISPENEKFSKVFANSSFGSFFVRFYDQDVLRIASEFLQIAFSSPKEAIEEKFILMYSHVWGNNKVEESTGFEVGSSSQDYLASGSCVISPIESLNPQYQSIKADIVIESVDSFWTIEDTASLVILDL